MFRATNSRQLPTTAILHTYTPRSRTLFSPVPCKNNVPRARERLTCTSISHTAPQKKKKLQPLVVAKREETYMYKKGRAVVRARVVRHRCVLLSLVYRTRTLAREGENRRSDLSRLLISEKTEYESRAIVYYRARNGWDYSCCVKLNRESGVSLSLPRPTPPTLLSLACSRFRYLYLHTLVYGWREKEREERRIERERDREVVARMYPRVHTVGTVSYASRRQRRATDPGLRLRYPTGSSFSLLLSLPLSVS